MEKKSFIVHEQWVAMFADAPDADVGAIFKAMMRYTMTGEITDVNPMQKIILTMMIESYEEDKRKYEETCRKRKEAIEKRWNKGVQTNTNEYNGIQTNTKVYKCIQMDTDKDINKDMNKDINKDMESDKECYSPSDSNTHKRKEVNTSQREDVQTIVDRWNELPDCIAKVKTVDMNTERFKMLKERLRTYSLEDVLTAIDNIEMSPFLLGDNKSRWTIKFDWFVRPNNFPKVLEGQYNKSQTTITQQKVARGISVIDDMIARGELRND